MLPDESRLSTRRQRAPWRIRATLGVCRQRSYNRAPAFTLLILID
ncbi:Hypothetical protein RAK1035_3817 [Roseovarius sp. AK1035]|nr:Hypothetical protein RAK1035_3817 [Roseovarius sp. AK1035]